MTKTNPGPARLRGATVLLANGTVLDGTGRPARQADVLVRDSKIAEVGSIPPADDWQVVDCSGMQVAPGFIDVHSHSDKEVLNHLPNKVLQGITTEVVGNCGYSMFPTRPNPTGERITGELFDGEPADDIPDAEAYFAQVEGAGSRVNVAALTGHSAVRVYTMKAQRKPSEANLQEMEQSLDRCLATGSIGFSTGLNCLPSGFGEFDELLRLCRVVHRHGAFYTTHMRDYKFKVVEAVDEALSLGRQADVPVQISHLQAVGQKNWDKLDTILERIERAQEEGLDLAMDAYPYLAGSCSITQLLPSWAQEGGIPALVERLASAEDSERIARETDAAMANSWDDILICDARGPDRNTVVGKTVARIAAERNRPAAETAIDLLREYDGYVFIISFNNNEENLRRVLTHPLTMIITDGLVIQGIAHPRTFGTYPKFLGEYVREKRWMPLDDAIVKTSGWAAKRFGLKGRGTIEAGHFADVVIFDAGKIGTRSDYEQPDQPPEGIEHVMVNGRFVVWQLQATKELPGMALRH